jgi:GNAT superfamily N-acetyltransferase
MIRFVKDSDINAWLELAREVEPLFGGMADNEDFKNGIKGCICASSALCAVNDDGDIEGIVAFDKAGNEICWLAVREKSRSKGCGAKLLEAALGCMDSERPVFVQTFAPEEKVGEAARKLYMRFGFKDYKEAGKNPAGINTIIMKLERPAG